MKSLAEALPEEQARCRELLVQYEKIGYPGTFGAMFIRQKLNETDQAVISGDPIAMLRAYETLKKCE